MELFRLIYVGRVNRNSDIAMKYFSSILVIALLLVSCIDQTQDTQSLPLPAPTHSVSYPFPTPHIMMTPPTEVAVTPLTFNDGKLYIGTRLILDLTVVGFGACASTEISYSPTYEYILVVVHCMEGVSRLFLFDVNGRELASDWDWIKESQYSWSPNGQSLLYRRYGCCSDANPALPYGLVIYHIPTGNRVFLGQASHLSTTLPEWSPDGAWLAYLHNCSIILASSEGYNFWRIDTIDPCTESIYLTWDNASTSEALLIQYSSTTIGESRKYTIRTTPSVPPTDNAKPIDTNALLSP